MIRSIIVVQNTYVQETNNVQLKVLRDDFYKKVIDSKC